MAIFQYNCLDALRGCKPKPDSKSFVSDPIWQKIKTPIDIWERDCNCKKVKELEAKLQALETKVKELENSLGLA